MSSRPWPQARSDAHRECDEQGDQRESQRRVARHKGFDVWEERGACQRRLLQGACAEGSIAGRRVSASRARAGGGRRAERMRIAWRKTALETM